MLAIVVVVVVADEDLGRPLATANPLALFFLIWVIGVSVVLLRSAPVTP